MIDIIVGAKHSAMLSIVEEAGIVSGEIYDTSISLLDAHVMGKNVVLLPAKSQFLWEGSLTSLPSSID